MTMPETKPAAEGGATATRRESRKRDRKKNVAGTEHIHIPGPAKSMYGAYLGVLALLLYSGFYTFHAFTSGWRYPWSYALMNDLNMFLVWILALLAVVYLYYALVARPAGWNEPLGAFRIVLAVLAILFWFVAYATLKPFGFLHGMVNIFGGVSGIFKLYELFLWVLLLTNIIYLYARWAVSSRYPALVENKPE